MVDFARSQFTPDAVPNLRFERGDARSLSFRGEFDLVVSFNALHWVVEQERALRSIRAALKPTGRARLRFVPDGAEKSLEDTIEVTRGSPRWSRFFAGFRRPFVHFLPEEYARLCAAAGLRVEHEEVRRERWDFGSRAGFADFCRATFVEWTQRLDEGERDAFIADVLDRYAALSADTPADANAFKFLQLEVVLVPEGGRSGPAAA
jgi:trans-aconitate methyltransferase